MNLEKKKYKKANMQDFFPWPISLLKKTMNSYFPLFISFNKHSGKSYICNNWIKVRKYYRYLADVVFCGITINRTSVPFSMTLFERIFHNSWLLLVSNKDIHVVH